MKPFLISNRTVPGAGSRRASNAFTVIELVVVLAVLAGLAVLMVPAFARSQPTSKAFQCQNNLRQLYVAWRQWADDHNDYLVTCESSTASTSRPIWVAGNLDWNGSNPSNYDTNQDIAKSVLWNYFGKNPNLFKCPSDPSMVQISGAWNGLSAGTHVPRVRTVSMNAAFGSGQWFDGGPNAGQTVWRTYRKGGDIVVPSQTFLFCDEHPDSINDAVLNAQCTGAQPGDDPTAARIIDFPASFHNGGANFSFADGHALLHHWVGSRIRAPFQLGYLMALNVLAGDSWADVHWLAQNTTVKQ